MATKLKKPAAAPKDVAVSPPPGSNSGDSPPTSPNHIQKAASTTTEVDIPTLVSAASTVVKKVTGRKATTIKKTVQLKVKGKRALKINPKNLARVLIENGKLKNGDKDGVVVKRTARKPRTSKEIKKELIEDEEAPPVLEPIVPQDDDAEAKKTPKKRGRKSLKLPQLVVENVGAIKQEPVDTEVEEIKAVRKIGRPRKIKVEAASVDHSSYLMDIDQIKKESSDEFVEPNKDKVLMKRQRDFLESLEADSNKKENIENSAAFRKLDAAEVRVIDRLDLNVQSFKANLPLVKRRHSIAKFPVTVDGKNETSLPQLSVFTQIPRSLSPKASRRSMRTSGKKSPYTTRSDSPAHLLRNGKHRRLKDSSLLDGLESPKRRKRVHSDKLSECESDSSFSDRASLPGGDKEGDLLKTTGKDTVDSPKMLSQDEDAAPSPQPVVDTNSNVCAAAFQQAKPSEKLPEKGLLLDIMKHTFNDLPLTKSNDEAHLRNAFEQEQQGLHGTVNRTFANKIAAETTEEVELRRVLAETDEKVVAAKVKVDDLDAQAGTMDQAPVLEKEDTIPVIDNIAALEPPQNSEHLDPPQLESSVPPSSIKKSELRRASNDDHKIGIAVTEMDNIVLFSIKHLPDDGDDHETSTEDNLGQSMDTSKVDNKNNPVEEQQPDVTAPKTEDSESTKEPLKDPPQSLSSDISEDNHLSEEPEKETPSVIEESPEQLAEKQNILNALGLFAASVASAPTPGEETVPVAVASTSKDGNSKGYMAPLKIRIHKKKGKNSFKMSAHKGKANKQDAEASGNDAAKHGCGRTAKDSSDTAGAHRKSHYSNRSNMDGSSEHTSDGEPGDKAQPEKSLIVPEKASSFSIHPGRLCKDECSYCVGKFGLFDTPCHIAQIKSIDRQNKILAAEKQLTRDSCLCDACYRHVDRKANSPSYNNKSLKRNSLVAPGPRQNHCHVLGCNKPSTNILRRKWIIKMRKSIRQVINIDLDNPGLHSIPICDEHYSALEHLMICAMCKRRLSRNHIHYLGPEVNELNEALKDEDILITLADKPVVCKLCKCFSSIILKDPEERTENSINFFKEYKKRLLHFNNTNQLEKDEEQEAPVAIAEKQKPEQEEKKGTHGGRKKKRPRNSSNESGHSTKHTDSVDGEDEKEVKDEEGEVDSKEEECDKETRVRAASTDTNNTSENQSPVEEGDDYDGVDYNTLIPAIAMDCPSDGESKKELNGSVLAQIPQLESLGNAINISRTYKNRSNNDLAAQKLCQNPSISLKRSYTDGWSEEPPAKLISTPALSVRQLFPGEEELGLSGDIEFKNVVGRTPEGWAKCVSTIQYDAETKLLWEQLQKPYGSQSSFLRHLILLEKYFRNGDLVLSSTASHHAVNYRESVCNRLRAYDNIPSVATKTQPLNVVQFNKSFSRSSYGGNNSNGLPPVTISQIGRSSDKQSSSSKTPITIQQLTQPPLSLSAKNKTNVALPELISLNQRAVPPPATRQQQPCSSQKIKFPITKNWRPNLIPIDPAKKHERKPGLVQVVSSGKPYYITLEDYKKMCAIKRSFEAKQKKLHEQQQQLQQLVKQQSLLISPNSLLKNKQHVSLTRTSGGTVYETIKAKPSSTIISGGEPSESILQKLDKQVERLGLMAEHKALEKNPAIQLIPKIPKSLTVIPQTVRKPPSPVLLITAIKNASDNENQS